MDGHYISHITTKVTNILDVHRKSRDVWGDSKIVGGTEVQPNSVPYQVSLKRLRRDGTYRGFCGAVIVSESHILTAAHCCDVRF